MRFEDGASSITVKARTVPASRHLALGNSGTLLAVCFVAAAIILIFPVLEWGGIFWGELRSRLRAGVVIAGMLSLLLVATRFSRPPKLAAPRSYGWLALYAAAAISIALAALWSVRQFQNSADEYANLFQARTFLAGRLWNPAPPFGQALAANYTWVADGKWVGQYPPGWPALLAPFEAFGVPWLANIILALITIAGVGYIGRREAGAVSSWLAALFVALSPFTIFTAASLFSHLSASMLIVLAVLASGEARRRSSVRWALGAGVALGMLGITRTPSMLVAMAGLAADLLSGDRRFVRAIAIGAGGVPFLALLLWYQAIVTGDPLMPVYWFGGREVDHFYFDLHSILEGLRQAVARLAELSLWTTPVVLLLWGAALYAKWVGKSLATIDLIFPLGVAMFFFYPLHPGFRYGPRYYFEFWPMMALTICTALPVLAEKWRERAMQLILLSICYGAFTGIALGFEYHRVVQDRQDLYRQVAARKLANAVVCVDGPSGHLLPLAESDLVRNGLMADGSVIYARCGMVSPAMLAARFPNRSVWIYQRVSGSSGRLARYRSGDDWRLRQSEAQDAGHQSAHHRT